MNNGKPRIRRTFRSVWDEIEYLYHHVLYWLYDKGEKEPAYPFAFRLQRLLDKQDPRTQSLLGMDSRAVMAELSDDWDDAARHRNMAVKALTKLRRMGQLANANLGPEDISDRLDLLALNYLDAGHLDKAWNTIRRSERLCREAGIPFDGADVKADIESDRAKARRRQPAQSA